MNILKNLSVIISVIVLNNCVIFELTGQTKPEFEIIKQIKTTSVKNQDKTGTCWSFATLSFIETEAIRLGKTELDLSEMYIVKNAYLKKASMYTMYHRHLNYITEEAQGGQAHDVFNVINESGVVPESIFQGRPNNELYFDHDELESVILSLLQVYTKNSENLSPYWKKTIKSTLDIYLGGDIEKFNYDKKEYTPQSFFKDIVGINPADYIEFTSYTHHPWYSKFCLEIPDNWSNGLYFNIPVNELLDIIDFSLENGFSVCWDGDTSEDYFNHISGYAKLNKNDSKPLELDEAQKLRQITFENWTTTDDHLMHITGIAKDKEGNRYYYTKNSWGKDTNDLRGYLFMSVPYLQVKTTAIMVHKNAVPKDIRKKIGL